MSRPLKILLLFLGILIDTVAMLWCVNPMLGWMWASGFSGANQDRARRYANIFLGCCTSLFVLDVLLLMILVRIIRQKTIVQGFPVLPVEESEVDG